MTYGADKYARYTPAQREGSEFGGTYSKNTIQPKGSDALTAGEELRLTYLVGDISDTLQTTEMSAEDRRQMLGLKPASNRPPNWLLNTGQPPRAQYEVEGWPEEYIEDGY
jgi:hypothetical protein